MHSRQIVAFESFAELNFAFQLMSGDLWYQLEATRAVNQAIGRVIRHAKDFGVILLCDVKFNQKSILDNLSKWLQPLITNKSFGASVASIKKFFNENNDRVSSLAVRICVIFNKRLLYNRSCHILRGGLLTAALFNISYINNISHIS